MRGIAIRELYPCVIPSTSRISFRLDVRPAAELTSFLSLSRFPTPASTPQAPRGTHLSEASMQTGDEVSNSASRGEARSGPVTRLQHNLVNGTPSGVEKLQQHRRNAGAVIDVSKLKTMSLRKYVRLYDLREVQPYSSKLDLCKIVAEHLDSMIIDEDQVLANLLERLRNDQPF